ATIFASAIDATIFEGNNPLNVSTTELISLISVVLVTTLVPIPNLNKLPTINPIDAAIAVVPNSINMVLDVNLPKFSSLFIFIITLIIDVNTNGITNIFNKSINPYPTRPYQLVTSFSQLICVGSLGNLAIY